MAGVRRQAAAPATPTAWAAAAAPRERVSDLLTGRARQPRPSAAAAWTRKRPSPAAGTGIRYTAPGRRSPWGTAACTAPRAWLTHRQRAAGRRPARAPAPEPGSLPRRLTLPARNSPSAHGQPDA